MSIGSVLIARERARQIQEEGFGAEHDDAHKNGELVDAAICYAQEPIRVRRYPPDWPSKDWRAPIGWPWEARWWKPLDNGPGANITENNRKWNRIRDLTRAGALIAAEIDRIERSIPAAEE